MRLHHKHWTPPGDTGPDLFSPPAVAVDTSREAAARIEGHTNRIREAIYLWIQKHGAHGATAGEITDSLGLNASTVRPRLRELQGDAPWAAGKLPARIVRLSEKRGGMRCYRALA